MRTISLTSAQLRAKEAEAQRKYASCKDPAVVKPATFVPTGLYTGNNMHSPRGNADDHFNHARVVLGAQIQRSQA